MKKIIGMLVFIAVAISNAEGQKVNFFVTECRYHTDSKTYKPCIENVTKRIVVYDKAGEQWVLYLERTEIYKVIHGSEQKINNSSDMISYQVVDEKNTPMVLLFIQTKNNDGTIVYTLVKVNSTSGTGNISYILKTM